jgi:hypothetical protein
VLHAGASASAAQAAGAVIGNCCKHPDMGLTAAANLTLQIKAVVGQTQGEAFVVYGSTSGSGSSCAACVLQLLTASTFNHTL